MSTLLTFAPWIFSNYIAFPMDGTAYNVLYGYQRPDYPPFSLPLYDPASTTTSVLFLSDYFV